MQLKVLRDLWTSGMAVDAGRTLYEAVPNADRPGWAADVLELACTQVTEVPPPASAVLAIARDAARWREAHAAFSAVRRLTLAEDGNDAGRRINRCLLYVAEITAKVTYNASGERAPFDHDSGWWVARNLRDFVNAVSSREFEDRAWDTLTSWHRSPG